MSTMFSEKKVPTTLEECYQEDPLAEKLWLWGQEVEVWGKIIFFLAIAGGILLTIVSLMSIEDASEDIDDFFISLAYTLSVPLAVYILYRTISMLFCALSEIVRHTRISANIALYNESRTHNWHI